LSKFCVGNGLLFPKHHVILIIYGPGSLAFHLLGLDEGSLSVRIGSGDGCGAPMTVCVR
jgi:hypothetical protein